MMEKQQQHVLDEADGREIWACFRDKGQRWEKCEEMQAADRTLAGADKEAGYSMFLRLEKHRWGCVALRAKYVLGWCHLGGLGVDEDVRKARALFKGAVRYAYHLDALYRWGYDEPVTDRPDGGVWAGACHVLELLEDFGADAHYGIACGFLDAGSPFHCEETGIRWLRRAAGMGSVRAMADLGAVYLETGDADLLPAAKDLLFRAAEAGSSRAGTALKNLCWRSITLDTTQAAAATWYPIAARYATQKTLDILFGIAAQQAWDAAPDCHRMGMLCAHRPQEAESWLRLAAENGYAPARFDLAHLYKARMKEGDAALYIHWLRKAADQGFAEARNELGGCYRDGVCVQADAGKAKALFQQAAKQGSVPAQRNFAWQLLPGAKEEAIRNFSLSLPAEAGGLIRQALAPGNARDMFRVGFRYQTGRGGFPQNNQEAERWLALAKRQMAEERPDAAAVYGQARQAQDAEVRFALFTIAALCGHAAAQFELSQCYADNCSVFHHPGEGMLWCTLAAEQGYPPAQFHLAMQGEGQWLLPAAEHGYPEAQYRVARRHLDAQEPEQAVRWLTLAAEQGFPPAQFELAECYRWSRGVPEDPQQAFKWYFSAAQAGDPQAQYRLGECRRRGYGVGKDV